MASILINFSRLSDADLLAKARLISTSLANHPLFAGDWPPYVPSRFHLDESIEAMQKACDAAVNRDSQKVKLKNEARQTVISHLKKIAKHVELVAGDNVIALQTCGYDLRGDAIKVKNVRTLAVPHLVVRHGDVSGTMIVKLNAVPGAKSYEIQITEGDPTVEENWRQYEIVTKVSGTEITSLRPGTNYSFRARAIGSQGKGPWSMPYTLMAL